MNSRLVPNGFTFNLSGTPLSGVQCAAAVSMIQNACHAVGPMAGFGAHRCSTAVGTPLRKVAPV